VTIVVAHCVLALSLNWCGHEGYETLKVGADDFHRSATGIPPSDANRLKSDHFFASNTTRTCTARDIAAGGLCRESCIVNHFTNPSLLEPLEACYPHAPLMSKRILISLGRVRAKFWHNFGMSSGASDNEKSGVSRHFSRC
jgi:hypothetical protein